MSMEQNQLSRLASYALAARPTPHPDVVEWAEKHVEFPQSALSRHFNASLTPWIVDPLRAMVMRAEVRRVSLCKPVQTAGSVAGEVALLYRMMFGRGFLQYNWATDVRAKDRWESRIDDIITSCAPVKRKIDSLPPHKSSKMEIDFGSVFFRMQGVEVSGNLDSDSVHFQLNEEVHSWPPGHLQKARNRGSAIWNSKSCDVSNASDAGDQFDQAVQAGTMRRWEVKCPGCGLFHYMRTYWDNNRPDLGGLRYDASGCRRPGGQYDYLKLKSTVFFWMPCGYRVPYDIMERRRLSDSGRYSDPGNTGADGSHESYMYEAVTTHVVDWMDLIKEKHDALRALRRGDPAPWVKYRQERECLFYDSKDLPNANPIILSRNVKKTRAGLPGEKYRLAALDYQAGEAGELPHWWMVIRDVQLVDEKLRSMLVFEGKVETDDNVAATLDDHGVHPWLVVADSGDETTHVYNFCMRLGYNAIKGCGEEWFSHQTPQGAVRRVYESERPLHLMRGCAPRFAYIKSVKAGRIVARPDPREPLFWRYSKQGIRERLHWLVHRTEWIVPDDVSQDYHDHWSSEERVELEHPRTGEVIYEWHQLKKRNDLRVCEAYIAMQIDQAALIQDQKQKGKTDGHHDGRTGATEDGQGAVQRGAEPVDEPGEAERSSGW